MKRITFFIAIFILFTSIFTSCRMYSKFPKVSIITSKGIEFNNEIYFIIQYEIYKRPKGIMKFPDGGLPKSLINEYYIVKYNKNTKENSLIYYLNDIKLKIESINIFENGNKIFFPVKYKVDKKVWKNTVSKTEKTLKEKIFIIDTKTDKIIVKTNEYIIDKHSDNQNIINIKATADLVRFIYDYDKLGLPSPLKYMKLSDKNIKELLLHDYLNGRMHIALIYYMIKNNKTKLLEEIEKENTDKYIAADIRYFKEGWSIKQLKEYYKSIK